MSETTAAYQVKAKSGIMNNNTRNDFAAYGLEILKRSVLLVLYDQQTSGENRRFTRFEICEMCGIKAPGDRAIDNMQLIEGILQHLREDGTVESNAVNRWRITQKGVSLIEGS